MNYFLGRPVSSLIDTEGHRELMVHVKGQVDFHVLEQIRHRVYFQVEHIEKIQDQVIEDLS